VSDKPPLLFLAHRIPYPPNKGDKIRSWHLLRFLSEHFRIYLGTFVDDEDDWRHCATLRQYCADAFFVRRDPRWHKLLAASGLATGDALSVRYYRSAAMQRWVNETLQRERIDRALLFCSPMLQFVENIRGSGTLPRNTVIDFVDVDSEKWRQYAESKTGPMAWVYRREFRRLLETERRAAALATRGFLVSEPEAELFRRQVPEYAERIGAFGNGVDTDYFKPDEPLPNPYSPDTPALVFTGAMDYWPNIDAVCWFARAVLPSLQRDQSDLQFWIVGGKPSTEVRALADLPGVFVTGRVPDVRPYLQHALAAVAPMRIARGVQNKVLEAMAMGQPVLASPEALEGIEVQEAPLVFCCGDAVEYAAALGRVHEAGGEQTELSASVVRRRYNWGSQLDAVLRVLR